MPTQCRWIIDASDDLNAGLNSSILVYLSQLYTHRGLRFTEYAYYQSEARNYGGNVIHQVTEGNVFQTLWIRSFSPYLVVEFKLDRLEGNSIRVLDHFLDVYGFNLTYEITDAPPSSTSCSVRDCSYAGNCLLTADYT